jgi:hypothetical protein
MGGRQESVKGRLADVRVSALQELLEYVRGNDAAHGWTVKGVHDNLIEMGIDRTTSNGSRLYSPVF